MKVFLLLLACVVANAQLTPVVQGLVQTMQAWRDTTADPCTDFYQYACGTFIANNPIPSNVTAPTINLPNIDGISYGNDALLAKIVNDPWPLVSDVYQSCMNDASQSDFVVFMQNKIAQLNQIQVQNATQLWQLITDYAAHGVEAFLTVSADVDDYQKTDISLWIGGNTVSWHEFQQPNIYDEVLEEMTNFFEMIESESEASADAADVIKIEEFIAQSLYEGTFTTSTVGDLSTATGIDFLSFFTTLGLVVTKDTTLDVEEVSYYASLPKQLAAFSTRSILMYFAWRLYNTMYTFNASSCVGLPESDITNFACFFIMQNSPYPAPWDQASVCRNFVHALVTDYVGLIFDYEVVTSDVYDGISNMTTGIQSAFNKSLLTLPWLDKASLANVQFKLENVLQIIGHPNVMDKYANLTTSPTTFFANVFNIIEVVHRYMNSFNTLPFNRSDYQFDPMIVNAFYSPNTNTINFPAGMLESPMFSGYWPKLFQYARMGYVVGHENTHGFDNQGTHWNAYGLPGDIFDNVTRNNFNTNAQCIANFYSNYTVYGTTHLNGNQTLGENIADIGGVKNSYRAYQNYVALNGAEFPDFSLIPDLTTDQVFFLWMGQTWCSTQNLAFLQYQLKNDVHSPSRFRVLGPLTQFDEFADVFSCPANTPMNPSTRCDLW